MPHAVTFPVPFLEIHECSDITIRAERNINGVILTDEEMFNGLSFNEGINLFDFETYTVEEIKEKVLMKEKKVIIQNNSRLTQMIDYYDTNAFGMQIVDVNEGIYITGFEGHRIMVAINNDVKLKWNEEIKLH